MLSGGSGGRGHSALATLLPEKQRLTAEERHEIICATQHCGSTPSFTQPPLPAKGLGFAAKQCREGLSMMDPAFGLEAS